MPGTRDYALFRAVSREFLKELPRAVRAERDRNRKECLRELVPLYTQLIDFSQKYLCEGGDADRYLFHVRQLVSRLHGVLSAGRDPRLQKAARLCVKLVDATLPSEL